MTKQNQVQRGFIFYNQKSKQDKQQTRDLYCSLEYIQQPCDWCSKGGTLLNRGSPEVPTIQVASLRQARGMRQTSIAVIRDARPHC